MITSIDIRNQDSEQASDQLSAAMQYWLTRFQVAPCESTFPSDRGPSARSAERAWAEIPISLLVWSAFEDLCSREGITEQHAIAGLLMILLHRYTYTESIEIGVHAGALLPVRAELSSSETARESLSAISAAARDAEVNACGWDDLKSWSSQAGLGAGKPLFRIALSVASSESAESNDLSRIPEEARKQCDVFLTITAAQASVTLGAEYNAGRYKHETIENVLKQIAFLVESFEYVLDKPNDRIPLCSPDEAQSIVLKTAASTRKYPSIECMHQRFEAQAKATPNAIAVVMGGDVRQQLTYSSLNAAANRLAHYLISKGIGPETLVGIYLDRTPNLIVAMLAIVKAGGAYLPIDLSYPPERVAFMLSDAEAPIVIADSQTAPDLPTVDATVVRLDAIEEELAEFSPENTECSVSPESLLYCIFTSGSTGKPKGVLITHSNVSRLFDATREWYHFDGQDAWSFFHSIAFDVSVWEIWGALIHGGKIVVVSYADSRSPSRFYDVLATEGVTILSQTPSAFRQLVGEDERRPGTRLEKLRLVIFAGEALNLQSLAPWIRKYGDAKPQLINMYGITETTVHSTYRPIKLSDLTEAPGSMIGGPIPDLELYLLDPALQPVPTGVPGELYVGGAGVARGYLKRDELTAQRFLKNLFPSQGGGSVYRSGDLARRLPDGDLEYIGRADQQVKIRGFRIELGEIQSALMKLPNVRETFVTTRESDAGLKSLVAYIVTAHSQTMATDILRRGLLEYLPEYMIPSAFVFLEKMPLTSNGKIDRARLPQPQLRRRELETHYVAPQTEMEKKIAGVYKEVLEIDSVGIDDNFFDLGGDSLKTAEAHAQIQVLLGRTFSAAELFVHTTVRTLAKSFGENGADKNRRNDVLDRARRQREAISANMNRRR